MSMCETKRPATFLGLRRSAFLEVGVYLGIAIAVDHLFFDGSRFWSISPHPFWPLILLVASQYGTSEALMAAGAATLAFYSRSLPDQSMDQDSYQYLFSLIQVPLLWLGTAVMFGELRSKHKAETAAVRAELESASRKSEELTVAYTKISALKEKLETRVAGQLRTAIRMYEAAREIERLDPDHVVDGALQIVRVVMNPEKFSLFLLKNDSLEIATTQGWDPGDAFDVRFSPTSPLFQEVIGRGRYLCSVSPDDERIINAEGLLVGPLVSPDTGGVVGMLKIEKISFLELNLTSAQTFKVLCEWIGTAYANALRYTVANASKIYDEQTSLFSRSFYERQTSFLAGLARRVGFDLSLIELRVRNANELTIEEAAMVPKLLGEVAQFHLRRTDMAFECEQEGSGFSVLLPNTALENARNAADKLLSRLSEAASKAGCRVQFQADLRALHRCEAEDRAALQPAPAQAPPLPVVQPGLTFEWCLTYLQALAGRVPFDVSGVVIRPSGALSELEMKAFSFALKSIVRAELRKADLLFEPGADCSEYRVMMPATSAESARFAAVSLADKVTQSLKSSGFDIVAVAESIELLIPIPEAAHV